MGNYSKKNCGCGCKEKTISEESCGCKNTIPKKKCHQKPKKENKRCHKKEKNENKKCDKKCKCDCECDPEYYAPNPWTYDCCRINLSAPPGSVQIAPCKCNCYH